MSWSGCRAAGRWDTIRSRGMVLGQCALQGIGALHSLICQQLPSASRLARATDEQWCCGQADPGLLEQREEWGQGLLVGCKRDLGLTQGRRSVGAAEKPTGISAAGSQVGQRQPGGADDPGFPFLFET